MATRLGTLTLDLVAKIGQFVEPVEKAGKTMERESRRIESSANSAVGAVKKLGGIALGGLTVAGVIEVADGYTQMAAQIRNATSSAQEYNTVQKHLLETANTTYRSLQEAQQVYLDVGGALKAYGYSTEQALRITDSLSFSFTHNATQADKAASATNAFMKSIYSGKVSGDAWVSILSAVPSVVDDLSKSLGKSKDQILTMGNAGQITSRQLNKALDESRESSEALANAMENSLADGLTKVKNEFTALVGEFNVTYGVTNKMAGALGYLGEHMGEAAAIAGVLGAVYLGKLAQGYASSIAASFQQRAALKAEQAAHVEMLGTQALRARQSAALALTEVGLARAELNAATTATARAAAVQRLTAAEIASSIATRNSTAATTTYTTATVAATGATSRLASAKSLLLGLTGGWVGLGVTVAAVAAGYLFMRQNTKDATVELDLQSQTVEQLVEKYRELDDLQRRTALRKLKEESEDLRVAYVVATSDLSSFIDSLENSGQVSEATARQMRDLWKQYDKGNITASDFATSVNNLAGVQQKHKDKIDSLTTSHRTARDAYEKVANIQEELKKSTEKATGEFEKQKTVIEGVKEAYEAYMKTFSTDIKEAAASNSMASNLKLTASERAEVLKVVKAFDYDKAKLQTEEGRKAIANAVKLAGIRDQQKATEDKIAEGQKRQAQTAENLLKINKKVLVDAQQFNYLAKERAKNLPAYTLTAIEQIESGGNPRARSSEGAQGKFQFMPKTAARFGVNVWDTNSSANGAAEYMAKLLDMFKGNLEHAVKAYNWGEGNMQSYLKTGLGMRGQAMPTETVEYWKRFQRAQASASGATVETAQDTVRAIEVATEKAYEYADKLLNDQQELREAYYTQWQALEADNLEKIKKIEESFTNDPTERDRLLALQQKMYEQDVESWVKAQDERVESEREANRQIVESRNAALAALYNPLGNMQAMGADAAAKVALGPQAYQGWQLNNEHQVGYSQLADEYAAAQKAIHESELLSDQERYVLLEQAYESYLENKLALSQLYNQQEQELLQSHKAAQLELWAGILSNGQNTFSQLTQSLRSNSDEQSDAYRTMFALQQGFSVASSLVAAYTAYTQAFADPSAMTLPQKFAGAASVMAALAPALATISSTAITGMAHNGIDNIPKEGTWLLDGGERVLNPQQNKDLTSYLANKSGGSDPVVHVYTLPGQTAEASRNERGELVLTIKETIDQYVPAQFNNPNSRLSKSVTNNFSTQRNRK